MDGRYPSDGFAYVCSACGFYALDVPSANAHMSKHERAREQTVPSAEEQMAAARDALAAIVNGIAARAARRGT